MIQQRNVGKSGLRVSSIGLGCNNFGRSLDLAASRSVIHKALDLGITFFDCADVYGRRGGAEWRKSTSSARSQLNDGGTPVVEVIPAGDRLRSW
jgi:aryl-alcohol dehydrogenase-like predicted oxidoreductase